MRPGPIKEIEQNFMTQPNLAKVRFSNPLFQSLLYSLSNLFSYIYSRSNEGNDYLIFPYHRTNQIEEIKPIYQFII